jgi:hypothetical protein
MGQRYVDVFHARKWFNGAANLRRLKKRDIEPPTAASSAGPIEVLIDVLIVRGCRLVRARFFLRRRRRRRRWRRRSREFVCALRCPWTHRNSAADSRLREWHEEIVRMR